MGFRTRRQAQLEDEEEVMLKREDAGEAVKQENADEDDNADDLDLDLPSIDDIINSRALISRDCPVGTG